MPLFDMDLLEEQNTDKVIEQFGDLIAFVAVAGMVNKENGRYPGESVNKDLFWAVAQKYDMDLEMSDEDYDKVYDFFQKVIDENEEEAAGILINWVEDKKTQKVMKELEGELDLPLLKDMEKFVQDFHKNLEAEEREQSSQIEEDRERESWQRSEEEEIAENYKQAKEYVDSLTTQEAVNGRVAQYLNNRQNDIGQYWALAQYELGKAEDTAAYKKTKQRVTSLVKNYMIPVMVKDIMTQNISDDIISNLVGYEAQEADRQRMQVEIEKALLERFEVALEQERVQKPLINEELQYDKLLAFIGKYSDEMKDPIAQRIKADEEKKVWKQRDDKLKGDIEQLKQNLKEKIDKVLESPEGEGIHQFMRNAKYLEEEEFRQLQEKGVTQERQAEYENTKAQLRDSSVNLIMSSIREAMNSGVSRIDLEGLPQSQDRNEIEKLRNQIQSEVETYIHGVIVDKVQNMDVKPEKPVNFMSSEQPAKKVENPQQAGVQNQEEKPQDVVENNVNKDAVNEEEEPKEEGPKEEPKPAEDPDPESGDEGGGFAMDELFDDDELDELGNPNIPVEVPKVNDEEVKEEEEDLSLEDLFKEEVNNDNVQVNNEEVKNDNVQVNNEEVKNDGAQVNNEEVKNDDAQVENEEVKNDNAQVNNEEVKNDDPQVENEEVKNDDAQVNNEEVKNDNLKVENEEVKNDNVQVNPEEKKEEPKVNNDEVKEEEEDLSLEDLFKEEVNNNNVQVNNEEVNNDNAQVNNEEVKNDNLKVENEEVKNDNVQVNNEEVKNDNAQVNPEEKKEEPKVNNDEVKVEEEEDLSLEELFKEEVNNDNVQVNPEVQKEEPEVNNDNPQVQVNPEVQEEEPQEQVTVDLGQRMVDLDAVEMNRNLHTLLEELQDADPFYVRSSPEFKNMKDLLTTMVREMDNRGDFLDYKGLRELTADMKTLRTLTDEYLVMKHEETGPSNIALRRMAVADRILNATDKYATALSGILNDDRTVAETDKLREMLNQSRTKEAQAVDKMPEGLGKDIAQNALLARDRLEQFACSKTALSESEQQEARGCCHLLISNRLVQMQSKKNVRMNLEEEVPMIINEVSKMEEFNVDNYTKDPKSIAEFLNNHMENKMIKDYIAELAQVQAQAKARENDGQVREHDDPQLHQQERVNENVR